MGVPKGEKREKRPEKLLEEIMAEKFSNLGKKTYIQVQETKRIPNNMNPKRNTPLYFVIKMVQVKDKEGILKAAKEKQLIRYKENPIRL